MVAQKALVLCLAGVMLLALMAPSVQGKPDPFGFVRVISSGPSYVPRPRPRPRPVYHSFQRHAPVVSFAPARAYHPHPIFLGGDRDYESRESFY